MDVAAGVAVTSPGVDLLHVTAEHQCAPVRDCMIQALGGPSTPAVWTALQVPCKTVASRLKPLSFQPEKHIPNTSAAVQLY